MLFPDGKPIYTFQSAEQLIEVSEAGHLRLLRTDQSAIQSAIDPSTPEQLVLPYMQTMMACLLFQPPPDSVLLLGLGGGDIVRFLHHHLPECDITAIDRDPEMIRVAADYFKLPKSKKILVLIEDALNYMVSTQQRYDTLLVDLYHPESLPEILKQDTFYIRCQAALKPGGVMVANLIVNDENEFRQVLWKIRQNFKRLTLCMTVNGHRNILVYAFQSKPTTIRRDALLEQTEKLSKEYGLDFDGFVENLFASNPLEEGELII